MQPILLAFGNRIALTADPVSSRATDASALPTHSRSSWGPHSISLFQKSVCPVIPPYCLLASELTVSNKAEWDRFIYHFWKKTHFTCVCAFFVVTSDAACWKAILISLCSNEFSNIPPKLRSHDAVNTPVHSHIYKKIGSALLYNFNLHYHEQALIVR